MIVFGTKHFKIKSFTQRELGISREEGLVNIDIQVRQKYAHLYWIPVFPTGKIYCFKRPGDDNLYELPLTIKQNLEFKHSQDIKTPWYSYALPLLGLLVALWFYVGDKISDISYENSFYLNQAKDKMMAKYPTTGDYYAFEAYDTKKGYNSKSIVLKVNSYDEDTIEFTAGYDDFYDENISSYNISGEFKKEGQYIYHPTRIDKDLLTKMMSREYRSRETKFKMAEYDNKYFKFKEVKRQELKDL